MRSWSGGGLEDATHAHGCPMAEQLVPDDLWAAVGPLLAAHPPQPNGGRPWISDRAVLGGLIDGLRSSTPGGCCPPGRWAAAAGSPAGGGGPGRPLASGSSCTIGCWPGWGRRPDRLVPSGHRQPERAAKQGALTGPHPGARGKAGSKYHLLIDGRGIPLAGGCRRPTPTTRSCWSTEWTRSRRSRDLGDAQGGRAAGRPSCTPLRATTIRAAGRCCAAGASARGSPGAASSPQRGWGGIAGGWSAALPGWWTSAACRSARVAAPTPSRPLCIWPAH